MRYESKINIRFWRQSYLLLGLLCLAACSTTKYLKEGESFVGSSIIRIEGDKDIPQAKKIIADLEKIVIQKPNTNFFGINRRWFYYQKEQKGKLDKEQKAGDRHIYEVPSIYEEDLAEKTVKSMGHYMENQGYFHDSIRYETKIRDHHAYTTYTIDPGTLFTVDSIRYHSIDTTIQKILNEISIESVFKKGSPVSSDLYEEEKKRITTTLRNRGFREFYVNYIDQLSTLSDTSKTSELDVSLNVFPRNDSTAHRVYKIGQITIYPYYDPSNTGSLKDTMIENILFRYPPTSSFPIKPSVISKRVNLKKDSLYSQENFNKTIRSLAALGIFKFADVKENINRDTSNKIDFSIFLPHNKKVVLGVDVEVRNTFFSANSPTATSGNYLGGVINLSYRNRNLLRGSEDFRFNFLVGGEFGRTEDNNPQIFRTFDVNPRFELNIPKFRDPLRLARLFNKMGLFNDPFYNSLLENATTRISLGVNWSQRRNFWGFFSGNLALGYTINNNPNRQYYLNQIGISFFNPNIAPEAEDTFENNPFLERSFNNKQLFTGLLFRDFGLTFTDRIKRNNDTWRLLFNMEISGLELAVANDIYNWFSSEDITFRIFDLDNSQFARLESDFSYYKYLNTKQSFAFRLNLGLAFPYGSSTDVPYVKQFFAGGPTSIRAWRVRELGPGGYQDPSTFPEYGSNTTPFYQTGSFKFIFSAEYRFKLFKIYALDLEGAMFLDGGNVWILREDADRPNAELDGDFLRQIALGTGVGFRMDFGYFKLALDLGYRLRNPYPNPQGSYWAYQRWRELGLRGINYNLSVGYPF